jgi:hypothetical protein
MQNRDGSYLDRHERIRKGDVYSPRLESSIVTRIPNPTNDKSFAADSPHPDVYRQALAVILETPEIKGHLNYITAGTIVTVLGSWLMGSMIKSRAFALFTDIMLFFASTAFAGLVIGIMIGKGYIPKEGIPVLLFILAGALLLVLAFLLGSMLLRSIPKNH